MSLLYLTQRCIVVLPFVDQNGEILHVISDRGADSDQVLKKVYETTRGAHKISQWVMTLFKIVNVKKREL